MSPIGGAGPAGMAIAARSGMNPAAAHPLQARLRWAAAACAAAGLLLGLGVARTEGPQGDALRIVLVHAPAAWLSWGLYVALAVCGALALLFGRPQAALLARAIAPTGALMSFVALWTGSLWVKPGSGRWWVWDARLTTELLLMFLYAGFIALQAATDDERRADRAGAVLALVGLANLPVLWFSLSWWESLHPGRVAAAAGGGPMATPLLFGLLCMTLACALWCAAAVLHRARSIQLEREAF